MPCVVPDRHAAAAGTTHREALQQGRALPRRALAPLRAVRPRVFQQLSQVGLEAVPRDIAGMLAGVQCDPVLAWNADVLDAPVRLEQLSAATIGEGPGVTGVMQHLQHAPVRQLLPVQFALVRSAARPVWDCSSFAVKYRTVALAEPVRMKVSNRIRQLFRTWASGSRTTLSSGS